MDNTRSTRTSSRRATIAGRAPQGRKILCIVLSCLIALPFGGTALTFAQANAEPAVEDGATSAPAAGDASASATVEVGSADASTPESLEAAHMPTLEEALGGGGSLLAFSMPLPQLVSWAMHHRPS